MFTKFPTNLLFRDFCEAVDPDARGRHRFPEAQLESRAAHVLAVHGFDGVHDAGDGRILTESVPRAAAAAAPLLDIDLYDSSETLKLLP